MHSFSTKEDMTKEIALKSLVKKEYDDVKTTQAKQAFSTDFLSHFFLKSVESIIFACCKPYLCTLQAVKS